LVDELSFDWYDKVVDVDVSLDTFFQQHINGYDGKNNNKNNDTAVYKVEHDGLAKRVSDQRWYAYGFKDKVLNNGPKVEWDDWNAVRYTLGQKI
jgi:hypothetical protein